MCVSGTVMASPALGGALDVGQDSRKSPRAADVNWATSCYPMGNVALVSEQQIAVQALATSTQYWNL